MREEFSLPPITEDAVFLKMQQLYTVEKFGWFLGRKELSSDLKMLLATPGGDMARILLTLSSRRESTKERTAAMMAHVVS
jgi:hypothetical protein